MGSNSDIIVSALKSDLETVMPSRVSFKKHSKQNNY